MSLCDVLRIGGSYTFQIRKKTVRDFAIHYGNVDDKYIIAGYADCVVRVFDAEFGICVLECEGHNDEIYSVL